MGKSTEPEDNRILRCKNMWVLGIRLFAGLVIGAFCVLAAFWKTFRLHIWAGLAGWDWIRPASAIAFCFWFEGSGFVDSESLDHAD